MSPTIKIQIAQDPDLSIIINYPVFSSFCKQLCKKFCSAFLKPSLIAITGSQGKESSLMTY